MGNVIKLDTVFNDPIGQIISGDTPTIASYNRAINTANGEVINIDGFITLNGMKTVIFSTKNNFYIHGYGIYTGVPTDPVGKSNYVQYVALDEIEGQVLFQNKNISVEADDGQFIVPLIIKNPESYIDPSEYTYDYIIDF